MIYSTQSSRYVKGLIESHDFYKNNSNYDVSTV